MKQPSAPIIHPPPALHPTELLLAMAVGLHESEENDHFLDYLSLAFAVIVTQQVNTSDIANNETPDE
ncbi:MAG: hypothetical protein V4714_05890 [Bacteroidota bacterium]